MIGTKGYRARQESARRRVAQRLTTASIRAQRAAVLAAADAKARGEEVPAVEVTVTQPVEAEVKVEETAKVEEVKVEEAKTEEADKAEEPKASEEPAEAQAPKKGKGKAKA